ncbi:hypothetical protein HBH70_138240 [Parastagonospora nodorum]|nr:hypothetical protein HBI03_138040 [Parastagonospora nodorum]KAH4281932.1 hypothetical protein HBI04_045310 [Parastagonospora nodorum]KAH5111485.1 hypothetical protein HBH72_021080 [Parastagonospora nodorum]KAH5134854.1 hypothetical protein HBH70_138240 [Parastagonospora nodorum]KAH5708431.1 hypothetical protein HBI18_239480 [Parastagonospora nodorum]
MLTETCLRVKQRADKSPRPQHTTSTMAYGVVCDASTITAHDDARCQACVFRVRDSNITMSMGPKMVFAGQGN